MISFVVPVKTVSPNRVRGLTRGAALAHAARHKKERHTAFVCAVAALGLRQHGRNVTLTRLSAGSLDGHDNLRSALKWCVDGIAAALGVNDGGPAVTWTYQQEKCKRGLYGVRVAIT